MMGSDGIDDIYGQFQTENADIFRSFSLIPFEIPENINIVTVYRR